ncbi:NADPH-dependent 2,4-dienoyl-CoA reductase, sulfur reductase [Cetobacterium ceti]|uniref:NADPH-dependent 2,4-dienoyl-CoA reductase, sulfur reductase n=1 Tax=Cetobacterium ceti TaxID=180163 RepID=A0A1T4P8W2_9FUSO|nr:CoA-disulfide reductase [Cetobacterium ceti]SJZ87973.1 NADPH-dependent 2,4-dienoyl-CoA reductase, sulfur reductase [Cetobacterium ceti]
MKIVIVGGVAAGMSVAAKAKRLNKDLNITVYEKTDVISWGACGLPYYVGDFYSNSDRMIARPLEKFIESGIDVKINSEVIEINDKEKTVLIKNMKSGEICKDTYDKLVISSGARAILPPIKNIDLKNVFLLKSFDDGISLKEEVLKKENQNIVIIGAGYIGLEVAEAMKHLGKKNIKIIQLSERVLVDSFDKEITDIIEEEIRSTENVSLHLEEMVTEFKGENGKIKEVITNKEKYLADLVVIATGVKPNTEFVEKIGIKTLKNGAIIINNKGETNIKDIYSAGDCATVPHLLSEEPKYIPLATTANKIGRVIGEILGGLDKEFKGTLGSAAVKVFDVEAGRTGLSEKEAQKEEINYGIVFIEDMNQTSYYPGQEKIYIKIIYNKDTKVLLGGQIVGKKGAVLRVDTLATAIYSKMTVDELGMLDLCYAPPFARTWDALNVVGNVAK